MLIQFLVFLLYVAIFIGVIYLFEKLVQPIDAKLKGILIFIFAIILLIVVLTRHSLIFW
jgi:hypothetical protein